MSPDLEYTLRKCDIKIISLFYMLKSKEIRWFNTNIYRHLIHEADFLKGVTGENLNLKGGDGWKSYLKCQCEGTLISKQIAMEHWITCNLNSMCCSHYGYSSRTRHRLIRRWQWLIYNGQGWKPPPLGGHAYFYCTKAGVLSSLWVFLLYEDSRHGSHTIHEIYSTSCGWLSSIDTKYDAE